MLSHEKVVEAVEDYFRNLDIGGKNKQIQREEPITFGARIGGLADVVLQSNARFVAIAECKNPWDNKESA